MTDLSTSTVKTWVEGQVTEYGQVAAGVITATVLLGLGIYLVFWGVNKIKGGLG
jgi:hypothetical protein